jgi:F-type H+-transporting ATPase subunit delta
MTPGGIGKRYGKALFDLAVEAGNVAEVAAGLAELSDAVAGLEEGALAPGVLSSAQRQQLATTFVVRVGSESLLGRFVGVLAQNDRLDRLPAIRDAFEKLEDASAGRVRAQIRTAAPLSDAERAALRDRVAQLTGRKVVESVEVDPELIGGVTVETEGRIYDGSIRTQLARLERRMAG